MHKSDPLQSVFAFTSLLFLNPLSCSLSLPFVSSPYRLTRLDLPNTGREVPSPTTWNYPTGLVWIFTPPTAWPQEWRQSCPVCPWKVFPSLQKSSGANWTSEIRCTFPQFDKNTQTCLPVTIVRCEVHVMWVPSSSLFDTKLLINLLAFHRTFMKKCKQILELSFGKLWKTHLSAGFVFYQNQDKWKVETFSKWTEFKQSDTRNTEHTTQ